MIDEFNGQGDVSSPATRHLAITPTDELSALPFLPKALFIGVGGDVTLALIDDPASFVTYKNTANGDWLPLRAVYVKATGTTATNIVAVG